LPDTQRGHTHAHDTLQSRFRQESPTEQCSYPESNIPISLVEACLTNSRFGTGRTQDYLRRTQSSTTSTYQKVGIWATARPGSITDPSCSTEPRHRGTRRYDVAPCGPMYQTPSLCTRRMYESSEAQWPREIDGSTSRMAGSWVDDAREHRHSTMVFGVYLVAGDVRRIPWLHARREHRCVMA
jgi:hypothetical protein